MRSTRISLFAGVLSAALTAENVTLNVVVKDRKGAPVNGLTAAQFEVLDGGAKRTPSAVTTPADGTPRLFPIVVETALSSEDRRLAKQAMLDLLTLTSDKNHLFAVFSISNQLGILQPFTADREALTRAIELATSGGQNTRFSQVNADWKTKLAAAGDPLSRTQLKMLSFDGTIDSSETPRRSLTCLDSLVGGLATQPGRKSLLYVSWGLIIPTNLDSMFLGLQGRANRAGVSFYNFQAQGVGAASNSSVRGNVAANTNGPAAGVGNSVEGEGANPNLFAIENATEALRFNPQLAVRTLADSTGGLLIADTNNPRKLLQQMIEDGQAYYEVTYDPGITDFNGAYRKTSIKVNAKDARIRDRDGYFALPAELAGVLPYELPMLKALSATPLPRDVEFRSGTLKVRSGKTDAAASVLVEVPFAGLTFKESAATKSHLARLGLLIHIKEPSGSIVKKFTRDLPLQIKTEQLAAIKNSNFNFREQFDAPPGRYVVEVMVIDQLSGKVGVRKTSFLSAAKPSGVSLSAVSLVRNFQPNAKDLNPDDPYQYNGGRITPTLQANLKQVKGAQLSVFFTVYPDAADTTPVKAVAQYVRDGAVVGQADVPLPALSAGQAKIPYVLSSPMDAMPPGTYEIRIAVRQGQMAAQESALVTIEP